MILPPASSIPTYGFWSSHSPERPSDRIVSVGFSRNLQSLQPRSDDSLYPTPSLSSSKDLKISLNAIGRTGTTTLKELRRLAVSSSWSLTITKGFLRRQVLILLSTLHQHMQRADQINILLASNNQLHQITLHQEVVRNFSNPRGQLGKRGTRTTTTRRRDHQHKYPLQAMQRAPWI